jgi:hypothetical protein
MAKKGSTEGDKGVSKMDLVRQALQELGDEAKPKDIFEHVKSRHGIEITPTMISSYKSSILSKEAGRSLAGRLGRAGNISVSLTDLEQVQRLIDRVGAAQLQHLIRVLAK